jgi:hypothetical protein
MPQVIGACPFQELNTRDRLRLQPDAVFHFLGGESLAPSSRFFLRQVYEGAFCRCEVLNGVKRGRRVAGTNPARTRAA